MEPLALLLSLCEAMLIELSSFTVSREPRLGRMVLGCMSPLKGPCLSPMSLSHLSPPSLQTPASSPLDAAVMPWEDRLVWKLSLLRGALPDCALVKLSLLFAESSRSILARLGLHHRVDAAPMSLFSLSCLARELVVCCDAAVFGRRLAAAPNRSVLWV